VKPIIKVTLFAPSNIIQQRRWPDVSVLKQLGILEIKSTREFCQVFVFFFDLESYTGVKSNSSNFRRFQIES